MTTFIKVPGRTGTAILIESLGGEHFTHFTKKKNEV
jgi:hypothetical protein